VANGPDEQAVLQVESEYIEANLNGDTFVSDPDTSLAVDDRVLLLSADVGG